MNNKAEYEINFTNIPMKSLAIKKNDGLSFDETRWHCDEISNSREIFSNPWGICYCPFDNYLYIADRKNNRIVVLDELFGMVSSIDGFSEENIKLSRPSSIKYDSYTNRMILVDKDNHRIIVFDPEKSQKPIIFGSKGTQLGKLFYPWDITTD
ncbi:MAG: hypothetical protein MHPSP_001290, partial [Paramarteilia canceri]